jgi:hypothetical protein
MAASFVSLVDEWRLQAPFAVEADPQLTLSPAIAQNFRGLLMLEQRPAFRSLNILRRWLRWEFR